jgi:hypothetical protein
MNIKWLKTNINYCLWAISGLVFLSALTKIKILLGIFNCQQMWMRLLIIVFFASAVLGFVELFRQKNWGFLFVYAYILTATFFFSISMLPFPFRLLNMGVKATTLLLSGINLVVFLFAGYVHAVKLKQERIKGKATGSSLHSFHK